MWMKKRGFMWFHYHEDAGLKALCGAAKVYSWDQEACAHVAPPSSRCNECYSLIKRNSASCGMAGSSLNDQQEGVFMHNSLSAVRGSVTNAKRVYRADLNIGDLFQVNLGRDHKVYMFTGARTRPPSGSTTEVSVNGKRITTIDNTPAVSRSKNGKDVIAFQSIVVRGDVATGEDGTSVSFENGQVYLVGRATIDIGNVASA